MALLVNRRREPDAEPVLARPAGTRGTPNGRTAPCMCLPGPLAFEAAKRWEVSKPRRRPAYRATKRGVHIGPSPGAASAGGTLLLTHRIVSLTRPARLPSRRGFCCRAHGTARYVGCQIAPMR